MQQEPRPRPSTGQRTGAKQRRRGLYGPPPRLTRTSPLTGRLLWHIGDWGRASEHVGQRWERLAADLLRDQLSPGDYLLVLADEPDLMAAVIGTNLAHADAFRAHPGEDGRLALEPLDFKWSLETASAKQVSGNTLARLLEQQHGRIETKLAETRTRLGLAEDAQIEPLDGRFVAPEHPANRTAIRDDPDLPCVLLTVDPREFFGPLPGWPTARTLARMEGVDLERMQSLEAVERYYRLGAGVAGALARLHSGLFEEEVQPVDAPALLAEMRRVGRAPRIHDLLLDLEQRLAARRALEERLAAVARAAYPFGRFASDLSRFRAPRHVVDSRGAVGRLHGEVMREVAAAVRAAGRDLVAQGQSEEVALEQLEATPERWLGLALPRAQAIAERLRTDGAQAGGTTPS